MAPKYASPGRLLAARSPARRRIEMKRVKSLWSGVGLTLLPGAGSLAPPLKTPVVPTADAYKEMGPWTRAEPADRLPRDSWWTLYDSAELDELQKRLIAGNPTLAAALANYAQARALADQARAGLFPTLGLSAGVARNRDSLNRPLRLPTGATYYDTNSLGGSVSYELDLWGESRNEQAADLRYKASPASHRRPRDLAAAPSGYRRRAAAYDCGQCQHRRCACGVFPIPHAQRSGRLREPSLLELAERAERVLGDRTECAAQRIRRRPAPGPGRPSARRVRRLRRELPRHRRRRVSAGRRQPRRTQSLPRRQRR